MKKILLLIIFVMISFGNLALASENNTITPDSNFYFLKKITENVQEFFTFNSEAKAKLQTTFINERINEIKSILNKENNVGLEEVKERLQKNLKKASDIVNNQKDKGNDVSNLAKELDSQLEKSNQILEEVFNNHINNIENKEGIIIEKINSEKNENEINNLINSLNTIKEEKTNIKDFYNESKDIIKQKIDLISEEMDSKLKAEKIIEGVEKDKEEVLEKNLEENILLKFNNIINQAKSAFNNGQFEEAKGIANQIEKGITNIKNSVIKLEEAEKEESTLKTLPVKNNPIIEEKIQRIEEQVKEAKENLSEERVQSIIKNVESSITLNGIIGSFTSNGQPDILKNKFMSLCSKYGESFGLEDNCDCFFDYVMENYSLEEMINLYFKYSKNQEITEELKLILKDALTECL